MKATVSGWAVLIAVAVFSGLQFGTHAGATQTRAAREAVEFGVLELAQGRDGWRSVFCRATEAGCKYVAVAARPADSREESSREASTFPDPLARTMAALGAAGWELVGEGQNPNCGSCRYWSSSGGAPERQMVGRRLAFASIIDFRGEGSSRGPHSRLTGAS